MFNHFIEHSLHALQQLPLRLASAGTSDCVALIIEPRCHPALEHVIRNAALFLGDRWQLQVVHGTENGGFITGLFSPDELASLQLINLGVDNLSRRAYSELLCSHWLWERVAAERVLVFQTDSLLLRPYHNCEWGAYDYAGAPWRLDQIWSAGVPWLAHAGNGGLSLRSRRVTLDTLDAVDYSRGEAEDVYFVEHLPRLGGRLAPRHVASAFAIEATDEGLPVPFGMHAAHKYLPRDRVEELLRVAARAYGMLR